jgi:hypothetical protein
MTSNSPKRPTGPRIEVPSSREDRLRLGRVGVIAAIGFIVGIAWPRLAGLKLAPKPPDDKIAVASTSSAGPQPPPPPSAAPSAPEPSKTRPEAPKAEPPVRIGDFQVTSCRNGDGDTEGDCGKLELKAVLEPKLVLLGTCEAAQGIEGVLSLGLDLDFGGGGVVSVKTGKSTTLASPTAHKLVECARSQLSNVSLSGIEHQHAQYTVFYLLRFIAPREQAAAAASTATPGSDDQMVQASGRATVSWAVAVVRDAPSTGGAIVTRLLSGTRVVVTGRKADWCKVQYDAKGGEGWVYRTAIGL